MAQKDSDKSVWDPVRFPSGNPITGAGNTSPFRTFSKLLVFLIFFVSISYVFYTLKLLSFSRPCPNHDEQPFTTSHLLASPPSSPNLATTAKTAAFSPPLLQNHTATDLDRPVVSRKSREDTVHESQTEIRHVVFGIAASAKLWERRKKYIKLWFKPKQMRGIVWLDRPVQTSKNEGLPEIKISGDTSKFPYKNRQGDRSAIRISRIVSETLRLGLKDVRWFVMGDDDTFFVTENLLRVLRKYDHNEFYYIGSSSESHLQNIYFSYNMAYGGGGFAISYPLAKALHKVQDRCIPRYPGLYGSDDRMQACMAELGVPLTKELGFHQYDVYGSLFGLLSAHPVTPLVTLHHLDVVEPIFPNLTRVQALKHLTAPMTIDSAALMQQSICYDKSNTWTVSISWGFAVQIFRGVFSPREIEMPSRTFLNWYKRADYTAYAFNTRPFSRNPCQVPFIFYLSKVWIDPSTNDTVSEYVKHHVPHPMCRWKMANPEEVNVVQVTKKADPHLWDRSPRRNCCRMVKRNKKKKGEVVIDARVCRGGELSEIDQRRKH